MPVLFAFAAPIAAVPVRAAAGPAWDHLTGRPAALAQATQRDPVPAAPPMADRPESAAPLALDPAAAPGRPTASMHVHLDRPAAPRTRLAISDQAADVRRCYQQALSRVPGLSGELTVALEIGHGGHTRGDVLIDDTGDWRLLSCVNDATARWLVPDAVGPLRLQVSLRPA
jgi:hypothetical protein